MKEVPNYEGLRNACSVFEDPEQSYAQIYARIFREGMYNTSRREVVDALILELKLYKLGSLKIKSIDNLFYSISDRVEINER